MKSALAVKRAQIKKGKYKKAGGAPERGCSPTPDEIREAAEEEERRISYSGPMDNPGPPVSVGEVANHLDLTAQRVSQLCNQGILPRNHDGTYPLDACRVAYIRFVRRAAVGRAKQGDTGQGLADARLMKVKMDIAVQKGILVNIDDVEANVTEQFSKLRAELAAIGSSVTRDLQLRAAIDEAISDRIDRFRAALEASAEADFSDSSDNVEVEEATA